MKKKHLTETEVHLYITDPKGISNELNAHVQHCTFCQAKAANYALLFQSIHDSPKPKFDFDLSALVMDQLPKTRK